MRIVIADDGDRVPAECARAARRAFRHDAGGHSEQPDDRRACRHGSRLLHRQDAARALRRQARAGQPQAPAGGAVVTVVWPRTSSSTPRRANGRSRAGRLNQGGCDALAACTKDARPKLYAGFIYAIKPWSAPEERYLRRIHRWKLRPTSTNRPQDNTLLIVDDDRAFLARLARAMETAASRSRPRLPWRTDFRLARRRPPAFAVVDMRLDDGNGIDVIAALKDVAPRGPRRGADRLRQYRHRRDGGEARRRRLSRQACRCRRCL